MNLALLVVSYGVSHRLFEFAWKGQLRSLYPTPALYQVGGCRGVERCACSCCRKKQLALLCALGAAGLH